MTSHRRNLSANDVPVYRHRDTTNRQYHDNLAAQHTGDALARNHGLQQQQQQQQQQQSHQYMPNTSTSTNYHHGKRASLAAFDPFSSSSGAAIVASSSTKGYNNSKIYNYSKASPAGVSEWIGSASPIRRDSSSSPIEGNDMAFQQRQFQLQPMTPPCHGRPIATSSSDAIANANPNANANANANANVKSSPVAKRSPIAKKVNKFLRKANLVKSLSLGQQSPSIGGIGSNSNNNNSGHKKSKETSKRESSKSPVVEVAAAAVSPPGTTIQASPMTNKESQEKARELSPGKIYPKRKITITTNSDNNNKNMNSMSLDLLELKDEFRNLQIPPLMAKNSPTSFLTGNGDEAVTTQTCSISREPTPFQLEIPSLSEVVTIARLNEFVEDYRRHDQNLDLTQFVGLGRMQLQQQIDNSINTGSSGNGGSSAFQNINNDNDKSTMVQEHVPIVQSLLECSEGDEISIQGFLTEAGDFSADSRAEAVVFQGQRNFTVVFRGTTEQQLKVLGNSKSKKKAVPLDPNVASASLHTNTNSNLEVYSGFLESYSKLEEECFHLVDKLVDENPFCDVVFSGYSFGAAMATLAALRYSIARPMMRVGCLTLASPKVGFSQFRHIVNNTPNLRVVRLELGGQAETKCQGPTVGGWHAGHTLVLNRRGNNSGNNNNSNSNDSSDRSRSNSPINGISSPRSLEKKPSVSVYKFETPKLKNSGFFKTSNPGLTKYISTLQDLATVQNNNSRAFATDGSNSLSSWPKDFANNSGEGVLVNNEKRLVV